MAFPSKCLAALLAGSAAAQPVTVFEHISDTTVEPSLLQFTDNVSRREEASLLQSADGMSTYGHWSFMEGNFGLVADDAPTWCKNDTQLTWAQRKERMQQHNTLLWAKKMVKTIQETGGENATVPEWMDKIVSDDEKKGKARWAVQESRRLKSEGKETPQWMEDLVAEDSKWANRWAACKAAQLKAAGEEAPAWMVENGRKGTIEAAAEKAQELQEQIEELDSEKEQEVAIVDAHGDYSLASQRMTAISRALRTTTLSQQTHALGDAIEGLEHFEVQIQKEGKTPEVVREVRHTLRKATLSAHMITKLLDMKTEMAKAQVSK
ncbi:unnamed protein product [Prorocentrum cordatum]|uniref:Uncharacterized protein n=1 Tax=Prorocentrum cordatum TaxID=2364126 RepID=A0ABN9VTA1_9DINO|nr:unnamed protein product [Polarella glacialis]